MDIVVHSTSTVVSDIIQPSVHRYFETRRVFVAILALGLFVMAARRVTDPDVWWHLKTGQLMVERHTIFRADPYSFTRAGQPWIDHEWLSQLLIFGIYRNAGWGGLITGFAAMIALAFMLALRRSPGQPYIAGAVTVWGAVASIPCWGVRPQMLTLLLASIFLFILERSYDRPALLWWMVPLMALWVNLHAGFAVGIAFLFLFLLGDILDAALGTGCAQLSRDRLKRLLLVAVLCIAVVALNPYGAQMYRYPFQTLHSRAMQAYIGEWSSPDFHQLRYAPFLLLILSTVILPALSPRRLSAREFLLLVVMTYAALRSVRHIPIYAVVAIPIVSGMIESCLRREGVISLLNPTNRVTTAKMATNAVLLGCFLAFVGLRVRQVVMEQPEVETKEFPAEAADFLLSARPAGPLLNSYNWGGYFIWKLFPAYKVYVDGRADVYGDAFLDEFANTYYLRGRSWQEPLERWEIQTVVLPEDAPLAQALLGTPGWKRIFTHGQVLILHRSGQP